MDDGASALRNRPQSSGYARPAFVPRRSLEAHHRRRRAVALAIIAILALLAGMKVGAKGGSITHFHPVVGRGYFGRIHTLGGTGPGSFAYAELIAENAAINRTLAKTPYVRIAGSQHREIALTFDDGPGPYTPKILSILQRERVPGTFFEVGIAEHYFHAATAQIAAEGFPIGDHTESHAPMSALSRHDQQLQLTQQASTIRRYGVPFPRLFRPPYGLWDKTTLRLLHKYRMLMVMWTVDTSDYRQPGVASIVHSAVSGARPGAIILLHDAGGDRTQTVAALPKIITALRHRGYNLVTVPKLLLDNPAPADQQITAVLGTGG
jgi:peptidoglycan/xylan/chitin deacetylase (PgdA/CDA1 family)